MKRLLSIVMVVGLSAFSTAQATPVGVSVTLDNPNITGGPGDSVTFTGTITNNFSTDYIIVDSTDFLMPNSGDQVGGAFGIKPIDPFGTYSDFAANNFTEIAPGQSYVGAIGSFQFGADPANNYPADPVLLPQPPDPDAQMIGSAVGDIDVSYDTFDGDPFNGGNAIGGESDALAGATISTPEPTVLIPLLCCAGLIRKRRSSI